MENVFCRIIKGNLSNSEARYFIHIQDINRALFFAGAY